MPTNAKICSSPLATLATLAISCPRYFSLFSVFLFSFASISGTVCAFYFTTRLTWPVTLLGSGVGMFGGSEAGRPLAAEYGN